MEDVGKIFLAASYVNRWFTIDSPMYDLFRKYCDDLQITETQAIQTIFDDFFNQSEYEYLGDSEKKKIWENNIRFLEQSKNAVAIQFPFKSYDEILMLKGSYDEKLLASEINEIYRLYTLFMNGYTPEHLDYIEGPVIRRYNSESVECNKPIFDDGGIHHHRQVSIITVLDIQGEAILEYFIGNQSFNFELKKNVTIVHPSNWTFRYQFQVTGELTTSTCFKSFEIKGN